MSNPDGGFQEAVDLQRVREAREALRDVIQTTPVVTSRGVDRLAGGQVFLKAENLQRTGSFKIRGAYNALRQLSEPDRQRGVVAASAGNHAQGVALAASLLGMRATIFMARTASISKIQATSGYGAEVVLEGESFEDAAAGARAWQNAHGAHFLSAYDDDGVITGQGTVALELLEEVAHFERVVVPVGGGGLLSGMALVIKSLRPEVRVIGVQAEGAPAAVEAWRTGAVQPAPAHPKTIADGIAIKCPSERTLHYLRRYVDDMITVSDREIADAVLLLLQRTKLLVEPAGAAATAALINGRVPGKGPAVALLSGGNIDAKLLSDLIERGMLRSHRYLHCFTSVEDRPGHLAALLAEIAACGGNVISITHNRITTAVPLGETGLELLIEVRDAEHGATLLARLTEKGYVTHELP